MRSLPTYSELIMSYYRYLPTYSAGLGSDEVSLSLPTYLLRVVDSVFFSLPTYLLRGARFCEESGWLGSFSLPTYLLRVVDVVDEVSFSLPTYLPTQGG